MNDKEAVALRDQDFDILSPATHTAILARTKEYYFLTGKYYFYVNQ